MNFGKNSNEVTYECLYAFINYFSNIDFIGENQSTSWATKSFMSCCCYHNLHFFQLSFHSTDPPFSFETSSQSRLSFFIKRASATHNR